jgi:hypothetical protein
MQRAVNKIIKEEVFSMWFAYIHCGATDVFSMAPPRDYISDTEPNQIIGNWEKEKENVTSTLQSKNEGSAEDWLWVIVIYCNYGWLYKKVLINTII